MIIVETGRLVNYIRSVSDPYETVNNVHSYDSDIRSVGASLIRNREGGHRFHSKSRRR